MSPDVRAVILGANEETFRAWNEHDPDAVAAVFAEDAEIVDVMAGQVVRGRSAIRENAATILAAFPDLSLERSMLLIDGETNADQWVMSGTHQGSYLGFGPTGRQVEIRGATFSEFGPHGLVTRDTNYIDVGSLLSQLGIA
ncbi:MAG: ester cyclase [Acidimicrobiia bacterium]